MPRYLTRVAVAVTLLLSSPLPASAEEAEFGGLTCGMESTNSPLGVLGTHQLGTVHAGPVVAADALAEDTTGPGSGRLRRLLMACWVQVNSSTPANPGGGLAYAAGSGIGVVAVAGPVTFDATGTSVADAAATASGDDVFLCTAVFVEASPVYYSWYYDDDPFVPGNQCALAVASPSERRSATGPAGSTQYVVEPSPFTATGGELPPPSGGSLGEAGFNNGFAGFVAVDAEREIGNPSGPARLVASCAFAGALTPSNTLVVGYGGSATARGPQKNATPILTAVTCTISNGDNSQSKDTVMNGPHAAVVDSTLLATSGPKEWAIQPVTICVEAFAVFGPFPVVMASVDITCETPDGR